MPSHVLAFPTLQYQQPGMATSHRSGTAKARFLPVDQIRALFAGPYVSRRNYFSSGDLQKNHAILTLQLHEPLYAFHALNIEREAALNRHPMAWAMSFDRPVRGSRWG